MTVAVGPDTPTAGERVLRRGLPEVWLARAV